MGKRKTDGTTKQEPTLEEELRRAHNGERPELHEAIISAGYCAGLVVGSMADVAHFFGKSLRQIANWSKEGMPRTQLDTGPNDFTYDLAAIAKWRLNRAESDDPLLVGSNSPGLERYRNTVADIKKLELDEKLGSIMELKKFREAMDPLFASIRSVVQSVDNRSGVNVIDPIHSAIDRYVKGINDLLAKIEKRDSLEHAAGGAPPPGDDADPEEGQDGKAIRDRRNPPAKRKVRRSKTR